MLKASSLAPRASRHSTSPSYAVEWWCAKAMRDRSPARCCGRAASAIATASRSVASADSRSPRLHQFSRGDRESAEATLRDAVAMAEAARPQHLAGDRSRIAFAHHHSTAYEGLVECLLARGANDEAFNIVQQAKSRALLELAATTDLQPASPVQGRFAELLAAET